MYTLPFSPGETQSGICFALLCLIQNPWGVGGCFFWKYYCLIKQWLQMGHHRYNVKSDFHMALTNLKVLKYLALVRKFKDPICVFTPSLQNVNIPHRSLSSFSFLPAYHSAFLQDPFTVTFYTQPFYVRPKHIGSKVDVSMLILPLHNY